MRDIEKVVHDKKITAAIFSGLVDGARDMGGIRE